MIVRKKDVLGVISQSFGIANNFAATCTNIRDVYLRIENEEDELKELKHAMVNAWRVYAQLFNIELQCKDRKEFENQVKSLIIWCYNIEDLIDKKTLMNDATRLAKTKEGVIDWGRELLKPNKVKELRERFGRIVKQWEDVLSKIKLVEIEKSNDPYLSRSRSSIGKDEDINEIVAMLRSCATNGEGISIIGTCGLGKSLLARTIFDSPDIDNQFCAKKLFPIKDGTFVWDNLKKDIEDWINSVPTPSQSSSPNPATDERDNNKANNVLIVFDNLLRLGDALEWGHFLVYVRNVKAEKSLNNKIIITTRNPSISQSTFTNAYYLQELSIKDLEELVKQTVELFKASPSETMLSTVKSVAKFCEGIPWVAERIGNVIAQQETEVGLPALEKRVSSRHASDFKEEILQQLSPCYIDLGPVLRRCLAYLSLFPKNYSFHRATLAHLWAAECFFKMDKELTILQQIDKYVNELTARSILQLQPRGQCCKPKHCSQDFDELTDWSILELRPRGLCCKLQYCGRDFAMLAASGTCLHLEKGGPALSSLEKQEVRHLSLSGEIKDDFWTTLNGWKIKLRTFLSLYTDKNPGHLGEIPDNLKKSLSRLRVFSLTETDLKELPGFMDALMQLRYLDISFTQIKEIPTKFPKNHPLQFLKLKSRLLPPAPNEEGKVLPEWKWLLDEVHKLTNLRYVDWEEDFLRANAVAPHIGYLTHLENLPLFRVGAKEGHFISELGGMDNLQGSICIENLEHVGDIQDKTAADARLEAQKAMLREKCGLRRIVLEWNSQSSAVNGQDQSVLRGLEPHRNVKELTIRGYGDEEFPEWITKSKLEKIRLERCQCQLLPALQKMESLKTLVLDGMENITYVSCRSNDDAPEFVSFPQLESMECYNMTNLNNWTELKKRDFPRLKELKFVDCREIHSSLAFIQNLKIWKPSVYISNESKCMRCNDEGTCNKSVACTMLRQQRSS